MKYQHNKNTEITKENYLYVREYKKQLLNCVSNLMNDLEIKYVIGHGNLIEYVRDEPIYHDDDIDIRYDINQSCKIKKYIMNLVDNKDEKYNLIFGNGINYKRFICYLLFFNNNLNIKLFPQMRIVCDVVANKETH